MSTLPDSGMSDAAEQIIDLIGDDTDFVRKNDAGSWVSSATDIKVFKQISLSEDLRTKMGIQNNTDYACLAPEGSDILDLDRTIINGIYWEVYSLNAEIGTHIEFGLRKTAEGP